MLSNFRLQDHYSIEKKKHLNKYFDFIEVFYIYNHAEKNTIIYF